MNIHVANYQGNLACIYKFSKNGEKKVLQSRHLLGAKKRNHPILH